MWSDWLVFCDCGFQSICPLMEKDKRLMEASWWERWTERKLGLVLIGGAMLSKSLIQFAVAGWDCVPSLLFDLRPNYGWGNEDNGTFFKRSRACTTAHSAPNPAAGHLLTHPSTVDSWMDTHGQVWVNLLWCHWFFLLGSWCTQDLVCTLQESVSQSCVSSGDCMVGLLATSSKRAYAISRSAAPRAPAPVAVHCWHVPPQKTLKHSSVSVSVSGSWCTQGLFEPSEHIWQVWGLILNAVLPLLSSCWGFSFPLGCGVSPQSSSSTTQLQSMGLQRLSNWTTTMTISF